MATCFSRGQNSPAGQVFCGTCGSPLDLSAFISAQVKTELDASTKERDLVETEAVLGFREGVRLGKAGRLLLRPADRWSGCGS